MPFKRPTCLASPENTGPKCPPPTPKDTTDLVPVKKTEEIPENERGTCTVVLCKKEGEGLGLTVSGGSDKECRSKVSNMRSSGIAAMSDQLQIEDCIVSVNGIRTSKMKHAEIISLLKNVGEIVTLEIEYHLPPTTVRTSTITQKTTGVVLKKEENSFGFVVRGGPNKDKMKSRPFVVTHIRPGSAADLEGTIKTGDRIISIDSMPICDIPLTQVCEMVKNSREEIALTIEYDVSVMDAITNASGPLLVEVSKTPGSSLGLVLTVSVHRSKQVICIEKILPGSIADRCGALRVGDQILSIDGITLDVAAVSVIDASKLLQSTSDNVRLEILPVCQLAIEAPKCLSFNRFAPTITSARSLSALNSLPRHTMRSHSAAMSMLHGSIGRFNRRRMHRPVHSASAMSLASVDYLSGNRVVHTENLEVCLLAADNTCPPGSAVSSYFGIQLQGGVFATELLTSPPVIAFIECSSAADKCGCIQIGDRLMSINGCATDNESLDEVNRMLLEAMEIGQVYLEIEFDVAESVVPSSGTFHVKLPKRRDIDLGIVISNPGKASDNEPLIITEVKRGSVAHRTGTLQAGDRLLAIDGVRLDKRTKVEDALALLLSAEDVVRLKIKKDEDNSDEAECSGAISFTVELKRYGGPLGITISGTEDSFDPIIISGLNPGGLAHRTGAIHKGDQILCINNISLRAKPLSEAIRLLQTAGETITLKIRKQAQGGSSFVPPIYGDELRHHSQTASSVLPRRDLMQEAITELSDPEDDILLTTTPTQSKPLPVSSTDQTEYTRVGPAGAPSASSTGEQAENDESKNRQFESKCDDDADLSSAAESKVETTRPAKRDSGPRRVESLRAKFESNRMQSNTWGPRRIFKNNEQQTFQQDRPVAEWCNALQDLQSVGQSTEIMRDLEESIMRTSKIDISEDSGKLGDIRRTESWFRNADNITHNSSIQLHKITLQKSHGSEDFGFSLSDGQLERGVFVHSTRCDGPADRAGIRPYDRLLQVNGIRTRDFDCCQAIPLIAQAGKRIVLVIARHPKNYSALTSHQVPLLAHPITVPGSGVMRSSAFETL